MPKPTPKKAPGLDEVEASAWADIRAAIESGDDALGIAALRDFVRACVKREMMGEYGESMMEE